MIDGTTAVTLALTEAHVGKAISVKASYIDGQGTSENLTSAATGAVVAVSEPGVNFIDVTNLSTTEAGGTDTFQVVLQAEPRYDVVLTLLISNAEEGLFQTSGTTSSTLTFAVNNWNVPQSVTLTGVDDKPNDGDISYVVQTVVTSSDLRYDGMRSGTGLALPNVVVANSDDDIPDEWWGDLNGAVIANQWFGGNGASDLYGLNGRDELHGGNGDDRVYGGYGDDVLFGDADNDVLEGDQGSDKLYGGLGNDNIKGSTGEDSLFGGEGNDTLNGGEDADSMDGGNGSDTYNVDNPADIVNDSGTDTAKDTVYVMAYIAMGYTLGVGIDDATLDGLANNGALTGNAADNTLTGNNLDNTLNGGDGADNLFGGIGADILYGGNGDDVVEAGDGNDMIVGGDGAGNDRYTGGAGADTVKYSSANAAINVNLTTGKASGSDIGSDTLSQIENVIGGKGNDTLTGDSAANSLTGDAGNDSLDGAAGNDKMIGGAGDDTYLVRQTGDVVTELANAGSDTINSYLAALTLAANIENGRVMNTGTAHLTGNSLANLLYAGTGNNVLNGGKGVDTVSYQYGLLGVTVNLAVTTAQATGGSGSDTLIAIENLIGSAKADTLTGNSANNVLTGGTGKDILKGNGGNDIFDFNALNEMGITATTTDTITDFNPGDKIDLSTLDANTATATNDAFKALFVAKFTAAGQLKFSNGVLYGNTDADATAEFAIVLTGVNTLTASDIVL